MAVLAMTSGQKGVLWWAAHHRDHHRHVGHARRRAFAARGLLVGARRLDPVAGARPLRSARASPTSAAIRSCAGSIATTGPRRRHSAVPVWAIGGLPAFVWGYLLSTVLLYHAHVRDQFGGPHLGLAPFATADDSRNNLVLALVTLGEGWHNNHHFCRSSCRQGVRWWEIDLTYLGLRLLAALGIARDLRPFVLRQGKRAA